MKKNESDIVTNAANLPTTDALKERFQARSIPLTVDFENLIDVAEFGRLALGKHPDQTPDGASGLLVRDDGQLAVKVNENKGLTVNSEGLGIHTASGLKVNEDGLQLTLAGPHPGVEVSDDGLKLKANSAAGLHVDADGVGIKTREADGLRVDRDGLKLAISSRTPGVEVVNDGLKVKSNVTAGMKVDSDGVGIVANADKGVVVNASGVGVVANTSKGILVDSGGIAVNAGHGIICDAGKVNIKLAKGDKHNGGGGQGADGTVNGSAGGLNLEDRGLSVVAGPGLKITSQGVSVKYYSNSGVIADKDGALWVTVNQGSGIKLDATGVGINTAVAYGLKQEENALKLAIAGREAGVEVTNEGLKVKPNADAGITVNASGIGVVANGKKGVVVNSSGVAVNVDKGLSFTSDGKLNLKLAKGVQVNGGGGQGSDGQLSGWAGGLTLTDAGLAVDAGTGMQIDASGVSVKCLANSGLSATEGNGLKVECNETLVVNNNKIGVVQNYLTKSGDNKISNGGLSISSDDYGVSFYGGSQIKKRKGYGMFWYKAAGDGPISICDNDGNNASPIATERYVQDNIVLPAKYSGLERSSEGLKIKPKDNGGLGLDVTGVGINTTAEYGLKLEGNKLKLSLSASSPGIELAGDGVRVKTNNSKGLTVDSGGIAINPGGGLSFNNSQLTLKLARGSAHDNGGGGQGQNGTTSGYAGGLHLGADGLSIDAGEGMQISANGISVKCYPNYGLEANQNGVWVKTNSSRGVQVDSSGVNLTDDILHGTNWTNLPLSAGLDGYVSYRRHGCIVFVKYNVKRTNGGKVGDGTVLAVMPGNLRIVHRGIFFGENLDGGGKNALGGGVHTVVMKSDGQVVITQGGDTKNPVGNFCYGID